MRSRRASSTGRVTRAGTPTTREPGGTRASSGTTAPAATTLPVPMWTPLRSTLPMPIRQSSSTVHPCRMARCPTPTRAPICAGRRSSTCTIVPSWRFVFSPITIASMSPRSTAPYHTLACAPSVTSPSTTAPGAMNAVGWMLMLLPQRLERPLDPCVHGLAVLLGRIPAEILGHVQRLIIERVEVGRAEHARLERRALPGDENQEDRLAREDRRVGGHRDPRRRQRDGPRVEAEVVLIVRRTVLIARTGLAVLPRERERLQVDLDVGWAAGQDDDLAVVGRESAGPDRQRVRAGRNILLRAPERHAVEGHPRAGGEPLQRQAAGGAGRGRGARGHDADMCRVSRGRPNSALGGIQRGTPTRVAEQPLSERVADHE